MFGYKQMYKAALKTLDERDVDVKVLTNEKNRLKVMLADTEKELKEAREIIDQLRVLTDATPTDCKRGSWCMGCEFVKPIRIYRGVLSKTEYFCGKAEACSNFVQKNQ